ncbi:MAG: tetratricopeptide repeat protein [Parvibaculaceae bacterium]
MARGVIATVAVIAASLASFPDSARADDDGDWTSDFYSYLPAAPDIKAPDLDFIPFWTDDLKKAKRAYKEGDFSKARKYFERASDDNNIVADWYLGHMYRLGRGVERDDAKAFSYYGRVADAFDSEESDQNRLRIMVDALVRVADYYRTGSKAAGVPQNFERASRIYRLAATYGHPASQYALGLMAMRGQGMRKQPEQGLRWLLAAAKKRYAPAEAALGDLYWKGEVVRRDRTRAIMWYLLARSTTHPGDSPQIYDRLDKMLAETSEAERLEAEARATVWADQYPADDEANQQAE